MAHITLQDGTTVEVTAENIKYGDDERVPGYVTTAHLSAEVQRRIGSAKNNARTELLKDADFIREVVEARGGELREDGTIKGSTKDLRAQEEHWKQQHLAPLQTQLDQTNQTVERYRGKALEVSILQAATETKVKPAFLKPLTDGGEAPIVTLVKSSFGYDKDSDSWGIRLGDGFRYGQDGRIAGAGALFQDLKTNPAFADYFVETKMGGAGYQGGSQNGKRVYTRAEVEDISLKYVQNPAAHKREFEEATEALNEGRVR